MIANMKFNFGYQMLFRAKHPIITVKNIVGRYQRHKLVKDLSFRAVDLCGPLISSKQNVLEILSESRVSGLEASLSKGAIVSGIAVSDKTINEAYKQLRKWHDSERLFLYQSKLTELPFSNNWFDCIYHIDNFYYWTDLESICSELIRVLKPGGMHLCTLSINLTKYDTHKGLLSKRGASGPLAFMMALERAGFEEVVMSYHDNKSIQSIQAVKPIEAVSESDNEST